MAKKHIIKCSTPTVPKMLNKTTKIHFSLSKLITYFKYQFLEIHGWWEDMYIVTDLKDTMDYQIYIKTLYNVHMRQYHFQEFISRK